MLILRRFRQIPNEPLGYKSKAEENWKKKFWCFIRHVSVETMGMDRCDHPGTMWRGKQEI